VIAPVIIPSSEYGPVITVRVGAKLKEFRVHKGLLCHRSLYFKNAFNGKWAESDKNSTDLPDDDPVAFGAFFNWLYMRRLLNEDKEIKDMNNADMAKACKIYVLGDRLHIPALKDAAIDAIISTFAEKWKLPYYSSVEYAFKRTSKHERLRRLLIVMFTQSAGNETQSWTKKIQNLDFWSDITTALFALRRSKPGDGGPLGKWGSLSKDDWKKVDRCLYYDHADIHKPIAPAQSSLGLSMD